MSQKSQSWIRKSLFKFRNMLVYIFDFITFKIFSLKMKNMKTEKNQAPVSLLFRHDARKSDRAQVRWNS